MEKLIIENPQEWLSAHQLKTTQKVPPLYVSEAVVYEFYKWSYRKARFTGIVIGLAIAVAIALIIKLMEI